MGLPDEQCDWAPGGGGALSIVDQILLWARPGITLRTTAARRALWRMCEVSKAFLLRLARRAVSEHSGAAPIIRFYTSDGTPMLVGRCWSRMLSSGHRVLRHARASNDFLCERTHYITTDSQGMRRSSVLFP